MAHGAIIRVTASDASMIFNHQACKEMAALSLERPNSQTNNRCRGSPPPLCERSSLLFQQVGTFDYASSGNSSV
jgi:hypothetical protein